MPDGPISPLVLIVGHDQPTRDRYAECAAGADLRVAQAHNGLQALEKAATLKPDIITTDLSLSYGLDGLEMCRRLGHGASTKRIPILALARQMPTEVEEARAAGCTSILVKPCSPQRLLVEILWVLARVQGGRESRALDDQQTATIRLLTQALRTALEENAELTTVNADLEASARLWADWYERTVKRAKDLVLSRRSRLSVPPTSASRAAPRSRSATRS